MSGDLSDFSMEELFRAEAEGQCASLTNSLLALEGAPNPAEHLEILMRAAHSLKGAARIIGLDEAVRVAHVMEDYFVRAQKANTAPDAAATDVLLQGVDLLRQLAGCVPGLPEQETIDGFIRECGILTVATSAPVEPLGPMPDRRKSAAEAAPERRDLRMDSERLDNLLGLAGQALVASRHDNSGLREIRAALRQVQSALSEAFGLNDDKRRGALLRQAMAGLARGQSLLAESSELRDVHGRRLSRLCHRIYHETVSCRMRPFGDITSGLHRMTRDLARELGKSVWVEVSGEETEVDRDLLDRLDGPLSHLIRNSLDHGIESPAEREASGKPAEAVLRLTARHQAGWLVIGVEDDGRGLNPQAIQAAIVRKGLAAAEHVERMTDAEIFEFLLLPGFSLKDTVTEISGRGVGLDAARAMAYGAGGSLRMIRRESGGLLCEMILPVSLSLVRALIAEIGGDCYALPLTRIERVLEVAASDIHAVGGRQHIFVDGERVEILSAAQVLELDDSPSAVEPAPVAILPSQQGLIGLTFDRFVGQRELSLQRLDAKLGRIQDVAATATLDSGEPVVVLDVNDLAITAANFSSGSRYRPLRSQQEERRDISRRILVADDSLTVRELERKLLAGKGYDVETAVDGADAWNALRAGNYDLLVTDIDMPRMDGIELVRLVRSDPKLRDLPVIVVSYKDREEDRTRGLEAGADFYLPKSSYQDESLVSAVRELIGEHSAPSV